MARRAAKPADTDPHGTAKPTTMPATLGGPVPYPGIYPGHPDATYCAECGHIAIGHMRHGPHKAEKA